MGILDELSRPLPTPEEMYAERLRKGTGVPKGPSRLQERQAEKPLTYVDEKAFKAAVVKRDGNFCRCCKRMVFAVVERVPTRREIHHIHGRRGDLRFEPKSALVLCCECHEKVTGRVNEKVVIVPTKTWLYQGRELTDARFKVRFEKVA